METSGGTGSKSNPNSGIHDAKISRNAGYRGITKKPPLGEEEAFDRTIRLVQFLGYWIIN
jgi:hypothetical protein